jgi:ribosomal subunit interface protein
MDIMQVSGQHVDVGDALREHCHQRINDINDRYNARMISAKTIFRSGPRDNGFECSLTVHLPNGVEMNADAETINGAAQFAFDQAADKVEKQVRRHVRALKNIPHQRPQPIAD